MTLDFLPSPSTFYNHPRLFTLTLDIGRSSTLDPRQKPKLFSVEPFKKILHCHWLIFSTDSQREVFVNTALVFTSECLLFRTFTITSDFYQRYLETFSTMFSLRRLRQTIWNLYQRLYTELEKNIDALRTNFVDKLLSKIICIFKIRHYA